MPAHSITINTKVLVSICAKAVEMIRRLHASKRFAIMRKPGHEFREDYITSVDLAVQQECYERQLKEAFPDYPLVCEEDTQVCRRTAHGLARYFTVDGMDGTREFIEGKLEGVSTMVAAVEYRIVVAACVMAAATSEAYAFGPDTDKVMHLSPQGEWQAIPPFTPESGRRDILLRRPPGEYSPVITELADRLSYRQTRASLGMWAMPLWSGEHRIGVLSTDSYATPWDSTPVFGLCERLGYRFYDVTEDRKGLAPCGPELPYESHPRPREVVIVHEHDLSLVKQLVRGDL